MELSSHYVLTNSSPPFFICDIVVRIVPGLLPLFLTAWK